MATSPSGRSIQSNNGNLQTPAQGSSPNFKQQRRMTSPAGLAPPPDVKRPSPRPPSPLRNGFVMDSSTGIDPNDESDDEDDDPAKWERSPSPSSSVSHLAASFVQRVNNFVAGVAPKSPGMLSDAELEAEAERERERSRREAEAILNREAQQRKLVEERVLEMMGSARSLPPPPSRSQTLPNPPSPSGSQKDTSWWQTAKNKLTPTKEPLTPAQQVIIDAKAREKERKKELKAKEKEKEKEWPANTQAKYTDPAYANLHIPVTPPTRKPVPSASPSSPTPSRPSLSNMAPNLTPSPMRTTDSLASSPSREAPPLYAQFNAQGTLDVPGTLLTIAKRFEKLEKWTVGHVRALEDRMNDVEKWLVEKEKEKEETASMKDTKPHSEVDHELQDIREEISELQGRVGELGREMAKLATAPSRLSSGPNSQTASITSGHQQVASTLVEQLTGGSLSGTPHLRRMSSTALESTSPPLASNKTPSGTRLPYPQGDYTSPPDAFSPPSSPPGSINARRTQSISISGLPNASGPQSSTSYTSSYGRNMSASPSPISANPASAAARAISPTPSANGLPPPKQGAQRQTSVSPTPRKRYTVALGGPLVPPDELSSNAPVASSPEPPMRPATPKSAMKPRSSIDNFFSDRKAVTSPDDDDDDDESGFADETIGKSTASKLASSGLFSGGPGMGDYKSSTPNTAPATSTSPQSSLSNRRLRAQSAYGFSSIPGSSNTTAEAAISTPSVAPLRLKTRSKSSERLSTGSGTGDGMISALAGPGQNKFVDPLVLRKQSKEALMKPIAMPRPAGKVPIGQLVAFFDGDKKK
ncbi:hypothetical protein CVT26_001711 [Gymnopilus dilepis]|uniref:Uncharacterized protein n=1 Tax=Gymnopilus dilepis TaxID=231916 RepID=A0A409VRG7_9AGAR|nr:hypothetical protein CVT26_001711 [Gymnopilus dilepis]